MEGLDYWRLNDELSIVQAALLVVGEDPGSEAMHVEDWAPEKRPIGYEAAKLAIFNAVRKHRLQGNLTEVYLLDENDGSLDVVPDSAVLKDSCVDVASLKEWLTGRGIRTGFFFPQANEGPDYLDPAHPHYAPKLAAAVQAWLAVEGSEFSGKSPKQVLVKWLREHAAEYGLSDEDGNPNETGIEETAKVANWQRGGGAPKTPG